MAYAFVAFAAVLLIGVLPAVIIAQRSASQPGSTVAPDSAIIQPSVTSQPELVTPVVLPPELNVASPRGSYVTQGLRATIEGDVTTGSTLTINDEPVALTASGATTDRMEFIYDIWLNLGENAVRIVATNEAGSTERTIQPIVTPGVDVEAAIVVDLQRVGTSSSTWEITYDTIEILQGDSALSTSATLALQESYLPFPDDLQIANEQTATTTIQAENGHVIVLLAESQDPAGHERLSLSNWAVQWQTGSAPTGAYWLLIDRAGDPAVVQIQELNRDAP